MNEFNTKKIHATRTSREPVVLVLFYRQGLPKCERTEKPGPDKIWLVAEVLRLSYTVANKRSKRAMFAGFAGDVRTLLPGKAKRPKKLLKSAEFCNYQILRHPVLKGFLVSYVYFSLPDFFSLG